MKLGFAWLALICVILLLGYVINGILIDLHNELLVGSHE